MNKGGLCRLSLRAEIMFTIVMLVLGTGEALGLSVYFFTEIEHALYVVVHCSLYFIGLRLKYGDEMIHLLPQPWWFLPLFGWLSGRGFIQIGASVGCPPGAGPVWMAVTAAPSVGAVKCGFSMLLASADPEVLFCRSIGRVRLVRHSITLLL